MLRIPYPTPYIVRSTEKQVGVVVGGRSRGTKCVNPGSWPPPPSISSVPFFSSQIQPAERPALDQVKCTHTHAGTELFSLVR